VDIKITFPKKLDGGMSAFRIQLFPAELSTYNWLDCQHRPSLAKRQRGSIAVYVN